MARVRDQRWEAVTSGFIGHERKRTISTVVIHAMAEFLEGGSEKATDLHAADFLKEHGLGAHYLVTPSGVVMHCVIPSHVAYHAKGKNQVSIGIEFLVPGVHTYGSFLDTIAEPWLTEAQFLSGVNLMQGFGPHLKVKRHSDISPGRKFDPGEGFPWDAFLEAINVMRGEES